MAKTGNTKAVATVLAMAVTSTVLIIAGQASADSEANCLAKFLRASSG